MEDYSIKRSSKVFKPLQFLVNGVAQRAAKSRLIKRSAGFMHFDKWLSFPVNDCSCFRVALDLFPLKAICKNLIYLSLWNGYSHRNRIYCEA